MKKKKEIVHKENLNKIKSRVAKKLKIINTHPYKAQ